MLVHRYWRIYRRKHSRERALECLGRIWAIATSREIRQRPENRAADLAKLAQFGRIARRLADQWALRPYLPQEPPADRMADHRPLPPVVVASPTGIPLVVIVERLLEAWQAQHPYRRAIEWRYGVGGQPRMCEEEIAGRLRCSARHVRRYLKLALSQLQASYTGEQ